MNIPKYNLISWILILLSIIFILLSFIAPIYLTEYFSNWDFSRRGVIGDAIGGTMNPFIAIAGVFSTFLAFLIQAQANKIQQDIFFNTQKKALIDEKIDAFYKISLLEIDIQSIKEDLDKRFSFLDQYVESVKKNPLATNRISRTVNYPYEYLKTEDRNHLYKSFKILLSNDKSWADIYNRTYRMIVYLPELYKNMYQICDNMNLSTYEKKIIIHDELIQLESLCVDFINSRIYNNTLSYSILNKYLIKYRESIRKDFVDETKKENDLLKILDILTTSASEIDACKETIPELGPIKNVLSSIMIKLNDLIRENTSTLTEINLIYEDKAEIDKKLNSIQSFIKEGMKDITIEKLQKDCYK